jgi:hypothetical protein
MLKDRIVRVKIKKYYKEQRPMNYVGKVTGESEAWLIMEAKGVMVSRQQTSGVQIDPKAGYVVIPRESIDSVWVLPPSFNLDKIQVTTEGQQIRLIVEGGADAILGELGEG